MTEVIAIQHTPFETIGTIDEALSRAGIVVRTIRPYDGELVPDALDSASGLIIMGGPMAVYEQDQFDYLRHELRLLERALSADAPILGICLGSQLLASALGAEIRKGPRKELGWRRVMLDSAATGDPLFHDAPIEFEGFHWHGDMFDLPPGSVRLASTRQTECQAFRHGANAYGVLFHLEVTPTIVSAMVDAFADEAQSEGIDRMELADSTDLNIADLQMVGAGVWRNWVRLLERS